MEFEELATKQREDIIASLEASLPEGEAKAICDRYFAITAPEIEFPDVEYRKVTSGPQGIGGGYSVKLGNIEFRLIEFLEATAAGALGTLSAIQSPKSLPLVVLLTLCQLWRSAKVSLQQHDTVVLFAAYNLGAESTPASLGQVRDAANAALSDHGLEPLSDSQFFDSLSRLFELRCCEYSPGGQEYVRLCESVSIQYGRGAFRD